MDLAEKRVLVTGGAGFIGSHVVDALVDSGARVTVLDDLSIGLEANLEDARRLGSELFVGSILDRDQVEEAVAGSDVIIHMACDNLRASLGNPLKTHKVNAEGTLNVSLAAAAASAARFTYVSSSEAYGSAVSLPMGEDHPLRPTTVYGASKAAGEVYAQGCMRTFGLPVTVVRPFNSYGPREHSSGTSAEVIPKFVARLIQGLPPVIFGEGHQTRDFTWVEETAAGIIAATAADGLVGEAVNIGSGKATTIRELAETLLELFGRQTGDLEFDEARPGDVDHHQANIRKASAAFNFEPRVTLREGLGRYVDWVKAGDHPEARGEPETIRNW